MSETVRITLGSHDARTIAAALSLWLRYLQGQHAAGLSLPTSPEHVEELIAVFSSVPRDGIHIQA